MGALIDFTRAVFFQPNDHFQGSVIMPHSLLSGVRSACALAAFLAAGNCLAATDLQAVVDASVKPLMNVFWRHKHRA